MRFQILFGLLTCLVNRIRDDRPLANLIPRCIVDVIVRKSMSAIIPSDDPPLVFFGRHGSDAELKNEVRHFPQFVVNASVLLNQLASVDAEYPPILGLWHAPNVSPVAESRSLLGTALSFTRQRVTQVTTQMKAMMPIAMPTE